MTHPDPATDPAADSRVLALAARCAQLEAASKDMADAIGMVIDDLDSGWIANPSVKGERNRQTLQNVLAHALSGYRTAEPAPALAAWKLYQPLIDAAVAVLYPGHTVGDVKALQAAVTASRLALAGVS